MINILQAPTPSISIESPADTPELINRKQTGKSRKSGSPKTSPKQTQKLEVPKIQQTNVITILTNTNPKIDKLELKMRIKLKK